MSEAYCFRCDWQGPARGASCPRCGAELYRPPGPPPTRSPEEAPPPGADGEEVDRGPPVRRPGPGAVLAAVAVVVLVVALVLAPGSGPAPSRSGPRLEGTLVYVSEGSGKAGDQLWRVDLARGCLAPGPIVPEVSDLVALGRTGWLGLTTLAADGRWEAYLLRSVHPSAEPVLVARGDRFAWTAEGARLVVARSAVRPGSPGCSVRFTLRAVDLRTLVETALVRHCGTLVGLWADGRSVSYLRRHLGLQALRLSHGGGGPVPHGQALFTILSSGFRPVGAGAGRGGGPGIWPAGSEGWMLLRVDGDRAWALLGEAEGVWVLRAWATPELGLEREGIAPLGEPAGAAATPGGTAYLSEEGGLYALAGGQRTSIPLPRGAPRPVGPVAWVP